MNRELIAFHRGTGADSEGRLLEEILAWPDLKLEAVHDYIQWLFPLPEPSAFNPRAPLLDAETIATFRADPALAASLRRAFRRMREFYQSPHWMEPGNHNLLRLTRILKSLRLLGLEDEAAELHAWLESLPPEARARIGARAYAFWREAATTPTPPR
jgi:hypothetical protein